MFIFFRHDGLSVMFYGFCPMWFLRAILDLHISSKVEGSVETPPGYRYSIMWICVRSSVCEERFVQSV